MTAISFRKATKAQSRARIALMGPAGSGKTYSALSLATALGQRVAVIDTERGSASKYADIFAFDVLELDEYDPRNYVAAINAAQQAGYDVLVIDSLSHAWSGKGGVLEIKDAATARSRTGDSFGSGWREASPLHNRLVDAMLQARVHLIATMRTKTEYAVTKEGGQTKIEKLGLAPVQRDGLEYEFDIVGDMDLDNRLVISKTRCPALHGVVVVRPDAKLAHTISAWLTDGVAVQESPGPQQDDALIPAGPGAATSVPSLDRIKQCRKPEDANTLIREAGEEFATLVERAVLDMHKTKAPREWWVGASIHQRREVLEHAVELAEQRTYETAATGTPPPVVAPKSSPGRAGQKARLGEGTSEPATTPGLDPPTTERGHDG